MSSSMMLIDDRKCFACGPDNPEGLRLDWQSIDSGMVALFSPGEKFQGWQGVVHGGILATVLDEAMTRLAILVHGPAVTAEITVRYIAPALIGEPLWIRGELDSVSRKVITGRSEIRKEGTSGPLIAKATGKIIRIG